MLQEGRYVLSGRESASALADDARSRRELGKVSSQVRRGPASPSHESASQQGARPGRQVDAKLILVSGSCQ